MTDMKGLTGLRRWVIGSALAVSALCVAPFAQRGHDAAVGDRARQRTQSSVYTLNAPSAGSLTFSLSNLAWPERLASLSFALTTSTGVLKTMSDEGQITIDLTSAGTYYALVSGIAQGHWNMGLFSINASFSPLAGGPEVPLPAAVWLLLSGLATTLGFSRRRHVAA